MDGKKKVWNLSSGVRGGSTARLVFVLLLAAIGAVVVGNTGTELLEWAVNTITNEVVTKGGDSKISFSKNVLNVAPFAVFGAILGLFVAERLQRGWDRLIGQWDQQDRGDKVTYLIGGFLGLLVSVPIVIAFQQLKVDATYMVLILIACYIGLAALSIYVLQTISEFLPWNRGRVRTKRSGIKILDTNVIIDGRIYDVAKTGFLDGQLYVPGFVLEELQYIADSHDGQRRQRGRRGLEVLKHMQAEFAMEVRIHDKFAPDPQEEVDQRLVRLAKALGGDLVTNDFNLKRVAELEGVRIMSLNDLSLALRPNVLPSEILPMLKILKEGNQIGQGVGYLEDGTMVVVENGQPHVGETMDVIVTQVIQTERGKMIFAEVDGEEVPSRPVRRPTTAKKFGL